MRRELARWFDPMTLPRRIRVASAPREDNGKLTRAWLRGLFVPERRVLDLEPMTEAACIDAAGRDVRELDVPSAPTSATSRATFPGAPSCRASCSSTRSCSAGRWRAGPISARLRRILRLKFKRIIGPGDADRRSAGARGRGCARVLQNRERR